MLDERTRPHFDHDANHLDASPRDDNHHVDHHVDRGCRVDRACRVARALLVASLLVASLLVSSLLAGCLSTLPDDDTPPASRVIVQWNPLECGEPHRVVLELEHEDGTNASASVPCFLGSLTVDLDQWGIYFGRFYGWEAGVPIRGVEPVTMTIDAPVIHWQLAEPP